MLPMCRPVSPDAAHQPESAPMPPRSATRLLLVEDDPLQARGLLRLLDCCGIAAHNVPTVTAALEAVASQPPYDIIVSDVGLPGLSGVELSRRLRRPLLVAYSGSSDRPAFFDAHVVKPNLRELLQILGAQRLSVVVLSLGPGDCVGHAEEANILCRASSPSHALRILATAIEASG